MDLPVGGASAGKGLRLQPAQQACLIKISSKQTLFQNKTFCSLLHCSTVAISGQNVGTREGRDGAVKCSAV